MSTELKDADDLAQILIIEHHADRAAVITKLCNAFRREQKLNERLQQGAVGTVVHNALGTVTIDWGELIPAYDVGEEVLVTDVPKKWKSS